MDDLYTQVLLHQALCQVAQDTANRANYQPYTPPERFIGPEPRSSAGWDSAYQQQAETRYRPGISRNEYTQVVERDGDALVDIRSMQLENSMGNKAARTFGTIGSKVSPWAAPRVTSGFMEGYHEDRYGIRKEDQSPEFKAAMRQASGRDFDNVTKSISKSVGGFVRNTVRGWNHENREEGIRLVKQGMGEFAEQVAPHVYPPLLSWLLHTRGSLLMRHPGQIGNRDIFIRTQGTYIGRRRSCHPRSKGFETIPLRFLPLLQVKDTYLITLVRSESSTWPDEATTIQSRVCLSIGLSVLRKRSDS